MPDERTRTEQLNSPDLPPPGDNGPQMEKAGPYERFIHWAAELPWWAIILAVFAVVVLYSMLTSVAYTRVIRFLTDDPQISTTNLYNAVLIVGEEVQAEGTFESETTDSVGTVINQLLRQEGNTDQMILDPAEIIAHASTIFTLEEGDIILTGTPAGVGPVRSGDQLHAEIDQLGSLEVSVR